VRVELRGERRRPVAPETEDEKRRFEAGRARREERLAKRRAL
jgi:hypothetical protein